MKQMSEEGHSILGIGQPCVMSFAATPLKKRRDPAGSGTIRYLFLFRMRNENVPRVLKSERKRDALTGYLQVICR